MDKSRAEDVAGNTDRDEDSLPITSSQTSWFKGGLAKLRGSRVYSVLVRPSALSVAGASIGIVSILLLTWGSRQVLVFSGDIPTFRPTYWDTEHLSFFDLMKMSELAVAAALAVFLVGTVFAFLMPAFGLLQGLGAVGFVLNYRSAFSESPEISEFGLGYYMAIISTFVVLISSKAAYGHPIGRRPVPATLRIAALSPYATRLRK